MTKAIKGERQEIVSQRHLYSHNSTFNEPTVTVLPPIVNIIKIAPFSTQIITQTDKTLI